MLDKRTCIREKSSDEYMTTKSRDMLFTELVKETNLAITWPLHTKSDVTLPAATVKQLLDKIEEQSKALISNDQLLCKIQRRYEGGVQIDMDDILLEIKSNQQSKAINVLLAEIDECHEMAFVEFLENHCNKNFGVVISGYHSFCTNHEEFYLRNPATFNEVSNNDTWGHLVNYKLVREDGKISVYGLVNFSGIRWSEGITHYPSPVSFIPTVRSLTTTVGNVKETKFIAIDLIMKLE